MNGTIDLLLIHINVTLYIDRRFRMRLFSGIAAGINGLGGGIVKGGVKFTGAVVSTKFPKTGLYIQ